MSSVKKINAAVAGATGYVGLDLVYLLSNHPKVKLSYLCAKKNIGKKIQYFDKRIKKKLPKISKLSSVNWNSIDILFTSLPTGESQKLIKKLFKYEHLRFIDLSADFRIKNKNIYKKFYKSNHKAPNLIKHSIYSISEFVKNNIKKNKIIACPGCYPTSIQLPLVPLLKKKLIKKNNIIIDSKSGFSGAGKNLKKKFSHKNLFSSIQVYGLPKHRHISEIDQEINKTIRSRVKYVFTPHLLPTFRGLLSAIYVEKNKGITVKKIHSELNQFYKKSFFIKIAALNKTIGTGNVINTNFCEISVCSLREKSKILILSAIDNLIKGAGGQAVQNMNLIFGYKENLGLR
tara:strand:- start:4531 stop:5565 length:1035 start_codon:yes stop_codon:yes gene_type:complete